ALALLKRKCSYLSPHQRRGKGTDIDAKQISTLTSCCYYGGETRIVCIDIAHSPGSPEKSVVPCICPIVHCQTLGDSIKVPTRTTPTHEDTAINIRLRLSFRNGKRAKEYNYG